MKQNRLIRLLAAGAVSAIALTAAFAQTTTTIDPATAVTTSASTSTVDGSGTITTYPPGSDYISFRTERSNSPVKYCYTKSTSIVDPEGKTVEWSMIKPNMPVKYTYVKEGDRMVVTKITPTKPVSSSEKTTTTTTKP